MKKTAFRNPAYTIRRENILAALRLPRKLPKGFTLSKGGVEVVTGDWVEAYGPRPAHHLPRRTVTLTVHVEAEGVANRIRVECPECRKIMRFCALQQHVGSPTCERKAAPLRKLLTEAEENLRAWEARNRERQARQAAPAWDGEDRGTRQPSEGF